MLSIQVTETEFIAFFSCENIIIENLILMKYITLIHQHINIYQHILAMMCVYIHVSNFYMQKDPQVLLTLHHMVHLCARLIPF